MTGEMGLIYSANDCELGELQQLQGQSGAAAEALCRAFYDLVKRIQVSAIYTYRLTAFAALRQPDPKDAAELWKQMVNYCGRGLMIIQKLKEDLPNCEAIELYNLLLDYREQADNRYYQNLQDSECADPAIMRALFPQMS